MAIAESVERIVCIIQSLSKVFVLLLAGRKTSANIKARGSTTAMTRQPMKWYLRSGLIMPVPFPRHDALLQQCQPEYNASRQDHQLKCPGRFLRDLIDRIDPLYKEENREDNPDQKSNSSSI